MNIKLGLKVIDDEEYLAVLQRLAAKKWAELRGQHYLARQSKTNAYLLQKGYEQALIAPALDELAKRQ